MDQADVAPSDPLAGVPELKTYVTSDEDEKVDALKLVADGVAQMRQQANNALIFHPLNLAVLIAILALISRYMLELGYDNIAVGTTCTGVLFAALAGVRIFTQGYLWRAESINWEWLGSADVIVTKFGDDMIGTAVVEWVSAESKARRKKAWRAEIKGWSVKMRYRKKGVGAALLEEAVKESKKKGAESLDFADDHASKSSEPVCGVFTNELCVQTRFVCFPVSTTNRSTSENTGRRTCCWSCNSPAPQSTEESEAVAMAGHARACTHTKVALDCISCT